MSDRDYGWLQGPLKRVIGPLFRTIWDVRVSGRENIPMSGPSLIAPNHLAFIDSVITNNELPRKCLAVGKAEYMDDWKTRYLFPALGMIPIDRSGGSASLAALELAEDSLNRGELFLIYPEGTRSRTGYLHKGRTGVARLALATGAPIVPVGLRGTPMLQPIDTVLPKLGVSCEIRFGQPIDVSRYRDKRDDRLLLRQITDEVMFEIAQLSGQTYVNVYAGDPLPDGLAPTADPPPVEPAAKVDGGRSLGAIRKLVPAR